MASRQPNKQLKQKQVIPETSTSPVAQLSEKKANNYYKTYALFFILSFLLYGNTLVNDYALDDAIVITQNQFTKKGFSGLSDIFTSEYFTGFFGVKKDLVAGGRYRPFSVATFAVEYEFFGMNPLIGHLLNILLYALIAIILYKILLLLFINYQSKITWLNISFITVILYMLHPIHTEVVANIKGRDELLSMLGAILAFYYALQYLQLKNSKYLIFIFLSFSMGMFSKESAITFLFAIPLAVWFFIPTHFQFKKLLTVMSPMVLASVIYLIIRAKVLGPTGVTVVNELMNDSFLGMTGSEKYATIFYTLGVYIKLLLFPHPLTYDYYPYHIPVMEWSQWQTLLSLLMNFGLGIWALLLLKKRHIISFAILFYFATLSPMSNVLFPIGVFMNERFVFIASLGFSIIIAWLLVNWLPTKIKNLSTYKNTAIAILVILFVSYTGKTISRNMAWENDFVLFTTDVLVSGNSAKSTCSAGGKLIEEGTKEGNESLRNDYLQQALVFLRKSVSIHPTYTDALLLLGNAHFEYNKNYDSVIVSYKKILALNPNFDKVWTNLEIVFAKLDSADYKIKVYEDLIKMNPNRFEPNYQLGTLYGKFKNNLPIAISYLKKAASLNPGSTFTLKDLGVAYGMSGKFDSSLVYLKKAVELDPKDTQTLVNIGITYLNIGQNAEAQQYFAQAKKIDPNIKTP